MDTDSRVCPHCHADLRADRIPQAYLNEGFYAPEEIYYYRTIGVEVPGVYDGALYWMCPDCGGKWHRFPEGHYIRQRAEKYVDLP